MRLSDFKKDYDLLTSFNLVTRTNKIIMENEKRKMIPREKFFDSKKRKELINQTSLFDPIDNNILVVFTGHAHGDYIGIDIDIKNTNLKMSNHPYKKILKKENQWIDTLSCTTPSGGMHYVYKLTSKQSKILKCMVNDPRLKLFGYDIDVLYNTGRFIMSGFYKDDDTTKLYKIIDRVKPAKLPEIVFNEILNNIDKNKLNSFDFDGFTKRKIKKIKKIKNLKNQENFLVEPQNDKDNELSKYIDCLLPKRCFDHKDWFLIGAIIYNHGGTFNLFNEWSKKCTEKYDLDSCINAWKYYSKPVKTQSKIYLLKKMAYADNKTKYIKNNRSA